MKQATEYRLHRIRGRDGKYQIPDGMILGHILTDAGIEVLVLEKT